MPASSLMLFESNLDHGLLARAASGLWQFIPDRQSLTGPLGRQAPRDDQRRARLPGIQDRRSRSPPAGAKVRCSALKRNAEDGLPLEYEHLRARRDAQLRMPSCRRSEHRRQGALPLRYAYVANRLHFVSVGHRSGSTSPPRRSSPACRWTSSRPQPGLQPPAVTTPGRSSSCTDRAERLQQASPSSTGRTANGGCT